jgi:hypothetical protein
MQPFKAYSTQKPAITIRYWRNLALAVIAAVTITVIITSQIVGVTQVNNDSDRNINTNHVIGSHKENVISGSIVLNPQGDFFRGIYVPDDAQNAVLQGNFTVTNSTSANSVSTVVIWSQQEFINYLSNHNSSPCYNKDFMPMPSGNINVTLSSGQYLILISGASVDTKILQAQIDLTYIN